MFTWGQIYLEYVKCLGLCIDIYIYLSTDKGMGIYQKY